MGSCASKPTAVQQQQPAKSDDKMESNPTSPQSEVQTEANVVVVADDEASKPKDKEDVKASDEEPKAIEEPVAEAKEVKADEEPKVDSEDKASEDKASEEPKAEDTEVKPEEETVPAVVAEPVAIPEADLEVLFTKAHTANGFQDKPVEDSLLEKAVELAQLAPTAFNSCPMRVVFVKSTEGKEKLSKCLMEGNIAKTLEAPVCAIVCVDHKFYEHLDTLCPAIPGLKEKFSSNPSSAEGSLLRNGNLQGGYLILALRSLGLDCGPMSGFDNAAVDAAFLEGTEWKSNFLINVGYSVPEKTYPRAPRLAFDVASQFA